VGAGEQVEKAGAIQGAGTGSRVLGWGRTEDVGTEKDREGGGKRKCRDMVPGGGLSVGGRGRGGGQRPVPAIH
jgi:hypothetical protein